MPDHRFQVRVHYEDTDMGGVVYHANYLKFIERARSDWVRGLGVDQNAMRETDGMMFAISRIAADYLAPARFDDVLEIVTDVVSAGGARLVMDQEVRHGATRLFAARITIVCIARGGRPARLPAIIRRQLR